ncbi:lycopene cyclase domain-containing protein [candidate division KSB1 bacterium]|nr:lycopene cyclase domain-containing protein [candidate division KSB1 bacterium]
MNHFEYLLFNLLVILGPLSLSFDRKVRFVRQWPSAFTAILMAAFPFLIWDIGVTGRHWWFNSEYTLDFSLLHLPPGEWLFFITVPFSSLFIWQVLQYYYRTQPRNINENFYYCYLLFVATGLVFFMLGKEYTGLTMLIFALVIKLDHWMRTYVFFNINIFRYIVIIGGLMAVFNGYLTARPVVLYHTQYQLGLKLITIPMEDFIYGYSLILLTTIIYERIKLVRAK